MIQITCLHWVPPFAKGFVRDHRVRWALEEAGLVYRAKSITQADQKSPEYLKMQPFGQVPTLEENGLVLFESGSIILYIGSKSNKLLPSDPAARLRAQTWVFAALNSIEQHVQNFTALDAFYSKEEWAKLRKPSALEFLKHRLSRLESWMQGREYLEPNGFTAGDLVMASVLGILRNYDILQKEFPLLQAYRDRCETRPAYKKAMKDHLDDFAESP